MGNRYEALKDRQQKEVNAFLNRYAFFAFNKDQFNDGLSKLGLTMNDTKKLCLMGVGGGYLLKDHAAEFRSLLARMDAERDTAIKDPDTGRQFAIEMFVYELDNHEYSYTGDTSETIESLGYDYNDIRHDSLLYDALREACRLINERETDE